MSQLEIRLVNKYDNSNHWVPETMFSGFKVRAVLKKSNDLITHAMELAQLRKRLTRELGVEDVDWILGENPYTLHNELYLQNSSKLIMWKLQDNDQFTGLFDHVEQHSDDPAKLAEQEQKDREAEEKAAEEARLAKEAREAEMKKAMEEYLEARRKAAEGRSDDDDDDDDI
jgi:hypothetical protein